MTTAETSMASETPLAEARGLGSAREGAEHWGEERASAAATFALLVWLAVSLLRLPDLSYGTVTEWLRLPLAAVPMLLLIAAAFRHLRMGLAVIVEDYAHEPGSKLIWLTLINFASIFAGAFAAFCVLKIAFVGVAA